jgi:hypothetical protein
MSQSYTLSNPLFRKMCFDAAGGILAACLFIVFPLRECDSYFWLRTHAHTLICTYTQMHTRAHNVQTHILMYTQLAHIHMYAQHTHIHMHVQRTHTGPEPQFAGHRGVLSRPLEAEVTRRRYMLDISLLPCEDTQRVAQVCVYVCVLTLCFITRM